MNLPDATDRLRIAKHEVGHALAAIRHGFDFTSIRFLQDDSRLGGLYGLSSQKKDKSEHVSILLAGVISEMLCYGDKRIASPDIEHLPLEGYPGFSNDYDRAESIALELLDNDDWDKVEEYLKKRWTDVVDLLRDQVDTINALSDLLIKKGELTKAEILEFLKK